MVDTLRDIGPGTIVIAGDTHFKVYKIDKKCAERTYRKVTYGSGSHFTDDPRTYRDQVSLSAFDAVTISAKTVPVTWRGPASSSDCKYHTVALFVRGDRKAFDEWIEQSFNWHTIVDMACAVTATDPDEPKPIGNLKGFNKMDLICAVIMVHGPSFRDDILRRVAALEGKPWVVSSNHEYFGGNRQGAIEDHCTLERGKKLYRCTVDGQRRGSQVIDRFGMEAIKAAG